MISRGVVTSHRGMTSQGGCHLKRVTSQGGCDISRGMTLRGVTLRGVTLRSVTVRGVVLRGVTFAPRAARGFLIR